MSSWRVNIIISASKSFSYNAKSTFERYFSLTYSLINMTVYAAKPQDRAIIMCSI